MKPEEPEEKRLVSVIGLIAWRWGTGIAVLVAAYGTMWVKTNAPTRTEFNSLREALQNLHDDFLRRAGHGERLDDHEERIRKLEAEVRVK